MEVEHHQESPPQCSECEYDLTGLPRSGKCPECGNYYDMQFKFGLVGMRTKQEKMDQLLRRVRTIVFVIVAAGCATLGLLLSFVGSARSLYVGLLSAGVFALCALTSWVYEKD